MFIIFHPCVWQVDCKTYEIVLGYKDGDGIRLTESQLIQMIMCEDCQDFIEITEYAYDENLDADVKVKTVTLDFRR